MLRMYQWLSDEIAETVSLSSSDTDIEHRDQGESAAQESNQPTPTYWRQLAGNISKLFIFFLPPSDDVPTEILQSSILFTSESFIQ